MPYADPAEARAKHARYMREVWYPLNREKQLAVVAETKRRLAADINALKLARGCDRCGYDLHAVALDFHHRVGERKLFTIAAAIRTRGRSQAVAEIEKCDLLCANCHRVEHHGPGEPG